jgi:hypothetical protein
VIRAWDIIARAKDTRCVNNDGTTCDKDGMVTLDDVSLSVQRWSHQMMAISAMVTVGDPVL